METSWICIVSVHQCPLFVKIRLCYAHIQCALVAILLALIVTDHKFFMQDCHLLVLQVGESKHALDILGGGMNLGVGNPYLPTIPDSSNHIMGVEQLCM